MYETLIRPHQVDVVPALPSVTTISDQLKRAEVKREEKRLRQIAQAHRGSTKRKREDGEGAAAEQKGSDESVAKEKRPKTEETEEAPTEVASVAAAPVVRAPTPAPALTPVAVAVEPKIEAEPPKISLSKAFPEVRGHTSYLTFAVLLPVSVSNAQAEPVLPGPANAVEVTAQATTPQAAAA